MVSELWALKTLASDVVASLVYCSLLGIVAPILFTGTVALLLFLLILEFFFISLFCPAYWNPWLRHHRSAHASLWNCSSASHFNPLRLCSDLWWFLFWCLGFWRRQSRSDVVVFVNSGVGSLPPLHRLTVVHNSLTRRPYLIALCLYFWCVQPLSAFKQPLCVLILLTPPSVCSRWSLAAHTIICPAPKSVPLSGDPLSALGLSLSGYVASVAPTRSTEPFVASMTMSSSVSRVCLIWNLYDNSSHMSSSRLCHVLPSWQQSSSVSRDRVS
jgi:hypothetical protein